MKILQKNNLLKILLPSIFLLSTINLINLINSKPVIGIVTNPYHDAPEKYNDCYLRRDTVKWLESAGAEVIPIHCWSNDEELDSIFGKINGIYFQTGTYLIETNLQPFLLARKIVEKVIELNQTKNIEMPLWGSGLGMEILHSVISGSTKGIDFLENNGEPITLTVDSDVNKTSRLFSRFSDKDIENVNSLPLNISFNTHGITLREYRNYRDLDNFFKANSLGLAYGLDGAKKTFIASVEAKNFAIFGVQFDPESICYNRLRSFSVPSGINAVRISHDFSNMFLNIARKNPNIMTKEDRKKFGVINTFEKLPQNRSGAKIYRYINESHFDKDLKFLD